MSMSKTLEAAGQAKPQASRWLCVGLMLLGIGALVITASMNLNFGESLARTDTGRSIFGASALMIDGMACALALVVGLFARGGRRIEVFFLGVVAAAFLAFSMWSAVGFGMMQRIGKSRSEVSKSVDAAELARATNAAAVKAKSESVSWLRGTYAGAIRQPERDSLLSQIRVAESAPVILVPVPTSAGEIDQQAVVWSEATGLTTETIQMGSIIALAGLLVMAKGLGFGLASGLWPVATVAESEPVKTAPEPMIVVPISPLPVPMRADSLDLVGRWRDEATEYTKTDKPARAETVYGWFQEWANVEGLDVSHVTQTAFGVACRRHGIPKKSDGRFVVYPGIKRTNVVNIKSA